ncbi:MAG: hypothetical protein V9E94_17710 [Microthrixaceae bacterium]
MASTRPSRRCIAVVATLVVLAAAAHAGPVSATSSPIFGGQFDTIPITVNGSYTPLPLHCFESYFDVLWYGRGSAPDSRWLDVDLAATPAVTSTKVPATVSGDYRPFVGDFDGDNCDDIFWYAPGPAPDFVWYFAPDHSYTSGGGDGERRLRADRGRLLGRARTCDRTSTGTRPVLDAESMWLGNGSRTLRALGRSPGQRHLHAGACSTCTICALVRPGHCTGLRDVPGRGGTHRPDVERRTTINGQYRPFSLDGPVLHAPGPGPTTWSSARRGAARRLLPARRPRRVR